MRALIFILFFLSVFAGFMTPMELGDVWWHLSTGQWILENMSLPDYDPFSIATDTRDYSFVLQGFWLSQIIFYLIQSATGLVGLIMFKALLFTSAAAVLWLGARRQGASNILVYVSIVPAILVFSFYDESRPQTFSILFTALTFLVLESSRRHGQRLRMGDHHPQPQQKQGRPWFPALIPIMVVWANLHPGFVFGLGLITIYAAEHLSVSIVNKKSRPNVFFLMTCLASILLAGLNPNGFEAVLRTLSMLNQSAFGTVTIHEHLGMSQFVQRTGETSLMVLFIFVACAGLASFVLKRRSLDLLHLFMFLSLGALSLVTFRAGLFFAIASAHIIGYNLSGLNAPSLMGKAPDVVRGSRRMAVTAAICLLGVAAGLAGTRSIAARGIMSPGIFPDKAAAYIEGSNAPANLYHPYEWGGYLIWRLYPGYRSFIDGRALVSISEHFEVQNAGPRWSEILEDRDVSTVLFWPMLPSSKRVPPIVFALARDPGWRAVYWDTRSLVFVRSGKAVRPLRQSTVWELLQSLAMQGITNHPSDAETYIVLGEIYANRGLPGLAREVFEKALSLDPDNREAAQWLRLL